MLVDQDVDVVFMLDECVVAFENADDVEGFRLLEVVFLVEF